MAEFWGIRRVKLTPPLPSSDAVRRLALIARLDGAASLPLVTVTAPAGYGKTTLLASWVRSGRRRACWLSLDEADGDLRRFAAYLGAAIRLAAPGAAPSLDVLLAGGRDLEPEAVAAVLADDLLDLPADVTLVIDDLHAASGPAPAAVLDALMRYPPPRLRLVIASREDAAGPAMRRLWSRGLALALTSDDLRFGPAEIAAVLGRGAAGDAGAVEASTGGWPAGVRALAIAGKPAGPGQSAPGAALGRADGAGAGIRAYLVGDALSGQPPERVRLLRAAAAVERLNPDLAAVLAGGGMTPDDARLALDSLVRDRFFCTRIDADWVRIHPVLRDALVDDLSEREGREAVLRQHRIAGEWHAARGMVDEALDHALKAGSVEEAAALMASHAADWFARDQIVRSSGFIDRLPAALVRDQPSLMLLQAHAAVLRGRLGEVLPAVEAAESLLTARRAAGDPFPDDAALRVEIGGLRCLAAYHLGDPLPVLGLAESLLSADFARYPLAVFQAATAYGHAMTLAGRAPEAIARLSAWIPPSAIGPDPRAAVAATACFHIASVAGDVSVLHWADAALRHAPREAARLWLAAAVMRFGALFEMGETAQCEQALALADAADRSSNLLAVNALHVLKAQFFRDRGCFAEAFAVAAEARRMVDLADLQSMIEVCDALEASIALAAGDLAAAGRWADRADPRWRPVMSHPTEPPPIVLARILVARRGPGDLARAEAMLHEAIRHGESCRQALPAARALPVLAVALAASGDAAAARDAMRRALLLTPAPLVRAFTVLGDPARALLETIAAEPADDAAAARSVLAAWPLPGSARRPEQARAAGRHAEPAAAVARLSNRELDVLRLIARRRSNKEIAAELRISPDTVKEYSSSVYRKLGVANRHEAADILRAAPEFA